MKNKCNNCAGNIIFSPKDRANVCSSCGSIFPVKYEKNFNKKDCNEAVLLENDKFAREMKKIRCTSCGASVLLSKLAIQANCPYCGTSEIVEMKNQKLMHIDSIIPFSESKQDALGIFKKAVSERFYANKKIFKDLSQEDIQGVYVNAFIFDLKINARFKGTFSYTVEKEDSDGDTHTKTVYKNVSGIYSNLYNNIIVEANSNLTQDELNSIMPFDFVSSVKFQTDFMNGYMLENKDTKFEDCFKQAETEVIKRIKKELLIKYNCENIVKLDLQLDYEDKKYNYSVLPVYFISKQYKDKTYKVVMNGQTGKVGKLPSNKLKVFLTVFLPIAIVFGFIFSIIFMMM